MDKASSSSLGAVGIWTMASDFQPAGRFESWPPSWRSSASARSGTTRRSGESYQDADLDGPSDRLVHDLVAIGDLHAVASRVREQLAAGANHVCLQVVTSDPAAVPLEQWRDLADLNVAIINPNEAHPSNPDKHQHQIDTTQGGDHR